MERSWNVLIGRLVRHGFAVHWTAGTFQWERSIEPRTCPTFETLHYSVTLDRLYYILLNVKYIFSTYYLV